MSPFFKNNSNEPNALALFAALFLCSVLLCVLYAREGEAGFLHKLQQGSATLSTPISSVGNSVASSAQNLSVAAKDATADPATLSGLEQQNEELKNMVSQLEEYKQQAQRLEGLLKLRDTYSIEGTTARVVGKSGEAYSQTLTLDAGSEDGVDVGQTVMGSTGVVGQIVSVAASTSTVRLLTDPASGCAVLIQSNRAEGIVRGSLEGLLYLKNISTSVEVNVGDTIVTSGAGGSYTSGLLVGSVVSIDVTQGGAEREIVVSPNATGANNVSEVIVIKSAVEPRVVSGGETSAGDGGGDSSAVDGGGANESSADSAE